MAKTAKAKKKAKGKGTTAPSAAAEKPAEQQAGAGGEAPQERVLATISARKLQNLLKICRNSGKEVASINGSVREEIGNAKANDHLHTGAFAVIRKLDKSPEKLADFMDYFDHYFDVSGLQARADTAQRLQFGPGEDGAESEDEAEDEAETEGTAEPQPEASDTTVRPFPARAAG